MQFKNKRYFKKYWPLAAVSLLLAGALVWGGVGWSRERSLRNALSGVYAKSFCELVGGMNTLEVTISKVIVSASPGTNVDLLSDISRQAGAVSDNLASLPLSYPVLTDTLRFINQLGDFCGSLQQPAGDGMPLTSGNVDSLIELHNSCAAIAGNLNELQRQGVAFTPMDPAYYLDGGMSDAIFHDIGQDKTGGTQYPTLIYDGPFSEALEQRSAQGLTGEEVDQEGARLKAAEFLGIPADRVRVTSASQGRIQGVMIEADAADGLTRLAVTLKGGHVQWMMEESDPSEARLTLDQCVDSARAEFVKLGYGDLAVTWTQQYDGICIVNFAPVADGVIMYPDLVKARISMDDGHLCGLDATSYLMNHHARPRGEPAISAEEAQKLVSPQLEVSQVRLAVVPTDGGGENLCWEFKGSFGGDTFFVYVDSATGKEFRIFRVINTESGALVV